MSSPARNYALLWFASIVAIPLGALTFIFGEGLVESVVQQFITPHYGSLLSGASGAVMVEYASVCLLALGGLGGFTLVHAFGRRFRFGVGWVAIGGALLWIVAIWPSSQATLQFAGKRLWLSTCGQWFAWDLALLGLGLWMVVRERRRFRLSGGVVPKFEECLY